MSDAKQEDLELFADPEAGDEVLVEEESAGLEPESGAVSPAECCVNADDFSADCISAGRYLHDIRLKLGIQLETVETETKIKKAYLKAIEEGNLDELPQPVHPVYVVSYVKKLGAFYKLDEQTLTGITEGLKKQILCQAPDDLSKTCYGHEVSEESLRRQKRLLLILAALAGAVVLLLAAGIIFIFTVFFREPDQSLNIPFDRETLLKLQPEPKVSTTPLPMVEV